MQHYYSTDEMENRLAGEGYSTANGTWVEGERIIFGLITIPAGTRSEPHSHPNEQFSIVLSGSIRVNVEGDEQVLVKDDINYRPADAIHSAEVVGEEDYVFVTAKDTSWGIQGKPATTEEAARKSGDGAVQHFYKPSEMEDRLAREAYAATHGAWIEGERLIFGTLCIPAGTKAEPHSHPNEQMIIVLSGSVHMDIDGDKRTCVKGDITHVPANAVHSAEVPAGEDYHFITAKDTSWGIQGTPVKG
jgi:quercetin dioxygenase-like cupin family protein